MDANREDLAGGGRAQNAALCDVLDGLPIWAPVISLSLGRVNELGAQIAVEAVPAGAV